MVIRVAQQPAPRPVNQQTGEQEEERTLVTSLADVERRAKEQAATMEAQMAPVPSVEEPEVTEIPEVTPAQTSDDELAPHGAPRAERHLL